MTDNEERLKDLQEGENHSNAGPGKLNADGSRSFNEAKLNQLQEGDQGQTRSTSPHQTPQESHSQVPGFNSNIGYQIPSRSGASRSRPNPMRKRIGIGVAVFAALVLAVIVGSALITNASSSTETLVANESSFADENQDRGNAGSEQGLPNDVPALAALVTKSTVLIECPLGLGTGFLLDVEPLTGVRNDRIIVTNQHVIDGCEGVDGLTVSNTTGSSKGSAIDYDAELDLAIIEAPAITGQPLTIGRLPTIGQWAMAVGNPEGITDTVTFGNITNVKINEEEEFILSDVLLGPGNSGGPLVDNQGKVLGINTAVLKTAEGFSFSIPVNNLCYSLLECQ